MPNVRALGRRLSCLVAGLFDGSPLPAMLEEAGFEVVHRLEPQETLKALDSDLWQVVFLSDSLGTPVLQSVIERSAHGEPPTPVVVVGTTNGEEAGALAMKLGAADFVAPPFSRDALDARLRRWLADPPPSDAGAGPPTLPEPDLPPLGAPGEAPQGLSSGDTLIIPAMATLSDVERILISEHLRRARTKADAAKSLGMGLRTLYTKIDKLQLADLTRRNGKPRSGRG
jgi:DNA-binding NtrC family response regulator